MNRRFGFSANAFTSQKGESKAAIHAALQSAARNVLETPGVAPMRVPRRAPCVPLALAYVFAPHTIDRAELELDDLRRLPRMPENPGWRRRDGFSHHGDVRVLLVLVPELSALQPSVERRAVDASREVAPVALGQRARIGVRTRCGDVRSQFNESRPIAHDRRVASRRPGLDDNERDT